MADRCPPLGRALAVTCVMVAGLLLAGCQGRTSATGQTAGTSTSSSPPSASAASRPSASSAMPTATAVPDAGRPCLGAAPPATWRHVVWVVMENKPAGRAVGGSDAPFLGRLASMCGRANNYRAVTHPSLPNYLAMTSGSTHGVTDDASPAAHRVQGPSLFSEVASVGGWMTYAESMPSPCDTGSADPYAVKHNPAAYYTGLAASCPSHDVPMGDRRGGAFASALSQDTLPAFALVIPDLCHDTHDCSVADGDAWLRRMLTAVLDSRAYRSGKTALFVTWDEDDRSAGNRVDCLVVAPSVRRGTVSAASFGHLSLLRTTEQLLGVAGSLVPGAPSMRTAFHL